MTDEQIKHMVQRFLAWKLPENLCPDNGISFKSPFDTEPMRSRHWPIGTNLLNAVQAEAMIRHMLEGLEQQSPSIEAQLLAEVFADHDKVNSLDWTDRAAAALAAWEATTTQIAEQGDSHD